MKKIDPRADEWRRKCADGSITIDDYKEVVRFLRDGRYSVVPAAKPKRTTKKKESAA